MSPLCHPSSLYAWLSCLSCFITHTPSCCVPYCDWPLSRDTRLTYNGRFTGVQSDVFFLNPGHTVLSFFEVASILRQQQPLAHAGFSFTRFIMSQVFLHLTWVQANRSSLTTLLVKRSCSSWNHKCFCSVHLANSIFIFFYKWHLHIFEKMLRNLWNLILGAINRFQYIYWPFKLLIFYHIFHIRMNKADVKLSFLVTTFKLWDMFLGWFGATL